MEQIEIYQSHLIPELTKAQAEGFPLDFSFEDAFVFWNQCPEIKYWIAFVEKQSRVCLVTETIVFRIKLPSGQKGCAVFDYKQLNDE